MLRGLYYLAKTQNIAGGETELQQAIAISTQAGGHLATIASRAKGLLALVYEQRGRHREAVELAREECSSKQPALAREALVKAKLCS